MSTITSTIHEAQATGSHSHSPVNAGETYDMTPRARKIVYAFLLGGVLFLAGLASYVWYGFYQWKNIP
jgi:hypothetical protein